MAGVCPPCLVPELTPGFHKRQLSPVLTELHPQTLHQTAVLAFEAHFLPHDKNPPATLLIVSEARGVLTL